MKTLHVLTRCGVAVALFGLLALAGARPAAAEPDAPADFAQFGFPTVAASALFTPGQATTLTAGNQQVVLPAGFTTKPVRFELLSGDPGFFVPLLDRDDRARPVLAAFAFRVTDIATGQRIEDFNQDAAWSVTDPRVGAGAEVYDTSASRPPKITENPDEGTVRGTTFTHTFDGADEGWVALGPEVEVGMPSTGTPTPLAALAGLAGLLCVLAGAAVRCRGVVRR
ncbi:MAG TPA: hypothetical protein VM536_04725 [Chloroflexia bacterium]|nr:hypothetical protein [Chloroflexia bacterium]